MQHGNRINVEIPATMRDAKGMPSRFLTGIYNFTARSGKAFQADVRPGHRPATDDDIQCLLCNRPLERRDSRQVGVGPDCARNKLGIRWPRKDELTGPELADVIRQLDGLKLTTLWFPFWPEVIVTTLDGTPIPHPVRPGTLAQMPPGAPVRPYATVDPRIATGSHIDLAGATRREYVPVSRPSDVPTITLQVGPPSLSGTSGALEMLDRMLAAISIKMPGFEVRPQQKIAMVKIIRAIRGEGDYPDVIAEIGTGGGKSLTLILAHLAATYDTDQPAIIATATKALQMQYLRDAPDWQEWLKDVRPFKIVVVKGRSNYLCLKRHNDRLEEYEQTGEVSFKTAGAARQFTRQIMPWAKLTLNGDVEDAPFTFDQAARSELTATRDTCAGKSCEYAAECWANKALEGAGRSNIVITNTRLAMEHAKIYSKTGGHAGVIPLGIIPRQGDEDDAPEPDVEETAKPLWYLDECHQTEDVARAALQREMTRGRFVNLCTGIEHMTTNHKAIKAARKGQRALDQEHVDLEQWLRTAETWQERVNLIIGLVDQAFAVWQERMIKVKKSSVKMGDETDVCNPIIAALDDIRKLLKSSTPPWVENEKTDLATWERLVKQAAELQSDLTVIANPGDPDVTIRTMELEEGEDTGRKFVTLIAAPISVAEPLSDMLWGNYPHVVAVSATIAGPDGIDHWRRRVGAPETEELIVPAPFNYPRQALMYLPAESKVLDPRGDARLPNTVRGRAYLQAYVDQCEQLVRAAGGGAFLLFTSNGALNNTYKGAPPMTIAGSNDEDDVFLPEVRGLADRLENDFRLIRQDAYSRKEATQLFIDDGNAVLFGVKTFWEGVDVPGQALRLVIVNAFPIPPPEDPVWAAMCDAVDRAAGEDGAWFRQLAIPNATIALKQGVGRLIRKATDTGVMAILDGRASVLGYGRQIVRALPPATQTRSLDDVRAFYSKTPVA